VTPGSLAYDTDHGCVGQFMAQEGQETFLRPIGGGVEWSVPCERVRPASRTEIAAAQRGYLNAPPPPVVKVARAVDTCCVPCEICTKAGLQ
jgi:hypothetical protein